MIFNKFLVNWKSPDTGENFAVGILEKKEDYYRFRYIKKALEEATEKGFQLFVGLGDASKKYKSEKLFPVFDRRIPNPQRKDFQNIITQNNMGDYEDISFAYFMLTGGKLATDTISFSKPAIYSSYSNNLFLFFDAAGWSHYKNNFKDLNKDTIVYAVLDTKNIKDKNAVKIIDNHERTLGYVPRPFNKLFSKFMYHNYKVKCKILGFSLFNDHRPTLAISIEVKKEFVKGIKGLQYMIDYHDENNIIKDKYKIK